MFTVTTSQELLNTNVKIHSLRYQRDMGGKTRIKILVQIGSEFFESGWLKKIEEGWVDG